MSKDKRQNGTIRRAYRRAALAEYNRNGGVCWLCGQHIDLARPYPDPMSFTADHVVPVALGGNVLGSVKPAHLRCNSSRGARATNAAGLGRTSRKWTR